MNPSYLAFAEKLWARGIPDPWLDGAPRFDEAPVVLDAGLDRALRDGAEALAAVFDEAAARVAAAPHLIDDFFGLSPVQKLLWSVAPRRWHGVARADLFVTADGLRTTELNCDTPSGHAEAVVLSELGAAAHAGTRDANLELPPAFRALIAALAPAGRRPGDAPLSVGIVYPTEFAEDLPMLHLLGDWLRAAGHTVVEGSPFNLTSFVASGEGRAPARRQRGATSKRAAATAEALPRVALLGQPCDVIVRHYKTDWWTERRPIWRDEEPYPDAEALHGPLRALLAAEAAGTCTVVNPWAAVLVQNKRLMAFLWEHLGDFSAPAQRVIRDLVPETRRLETMDPVRLRRERARWVIKSDYGCEGDEVILGADVDAATWNEALELAVPGRWIAQRHFDARAADGTVTNHGVFVVAGRAVGHYARRSTGATDRSACAVPVLIEARPSAKRAGRSRA